MSPFLVKTTVQSSKRKAKSISSPKKTVCKKQTGATSPLARNSKKSKGSKKSSIQLWPISNSFRKSSLPIVSLPQASFLFILKIRHGRPLSSVSGTCDCLLHDKNLDLASVLLVNFLGEQLSMILQIFQSLFSLLSGFFLCFNSSQSSLSRTAAR
jgi:hypothetical protein